MAEQERKHKRTEGPPAGEGGQPVAKVTEKGKKLKEDMDKLVIGVLHGYAIGGGLQLAVACLKLLTQLMELNPHYSFRHPFDRAF